MRGDLRSDSYVLLASYSEYVHECVNRSGVGVNAQMHPEDSRTLTRQRESKRGGNPGDLERKRERELPYCYYYLRVLYFANFCDLEKIAKISTRKNFYQHIRHVI